ncbi:MAG: hypothetical protein WAU90_08540 [Methyloceanibacter sp.]
MTRLIEAELMWLRYRLATILVALAQAILPREVEAERDRPERLRY